MINNLLVVGTYSTICQLIFYITTRILNI